MLRNLWNLTKRKGRSVSNRRVSIEPYMQKEDTDDRLNRPVPTRIVLDCVQLLGM